MESLCLFYFDSKTWLVSRYDGILLASYLSKVNVKQIDFYLHKLDILYLNSLVQG